MVIEGVNLWIMLHVGNIVTVWPRPFRDDPNHTCAGMKSRELSGPLWDLCDFQLTSIFPISFRIRAV